MKKHVLPLCLILLLCPLPLLAADDVAALLSEADRLCAATDGQSGDEAVFSQLREAMELSCRAAELAPEDFDANWHAARDCRRYAERVKWYKQEGWQDLAADLGRRGMIHGEKAIFLAPERVEGHFWYGCCVGIYADGVSIVTAVREGLVNKTRTSAEHACKIQPEYWDSAVIMGLGQFWYVLPWPLAKKDKARTYLEQYLCVTPPDSPNLIEGQTFLGQLLAGSKKPQDRARGKELLTIAAAGPVPFFRDMARETLDKKY